MSLRHVYAEDALLKQAVLRTTRDNADYGLWFKLGLSAG